MQCVSKFNFTLNQLFSRVCLYQVQLVITSLKDLEWLLFIFNSIVLVKIIRLLLLSLMWSYRHSRSDSKSINFFFARSKLLFKLLYNQLKLFWASLDVHFYSVFNKLCTLSESQSTYSFFYIKLMAWTCNNKTRLIITT